MSNIADLSLHTDLGPTKFGSGSIRTTPSAACEDDAGVTSGRSSRQGRGSLQESTLRPGNPTGPPAAETQAGPPAYQESPNPRSSTRTGLSNYQTTSSTTQTESHSSGTQTVAPESLGSPDSGPSTTGSRSSYQTTDSPTQTESHSPGTPTVTPESLGSPDSDPSTAGKLSNYRTTDSMTQTESHSPGTQPVAPESPGSPESGPSTITGPTNYLDAETQTPPMQLDSHQIDRAGGLPISSTAKTQPSSTHPEIGQLKQTLDRAITIEQSSSVRPNRQFTSSCLYRRGGPILIGFVFIVMVLMILDIRNEKAQWIAANEHTRQIAWVMRAGGSYGYPFLSWLLQDAFLEVDAYSYG